MLHFKVLVIKGLRTDAVSQRVKGRRRESVKGEKMQEHFPL